MNVFDFDKTIYDGDSTIDFYFYCLRMNFSIIRFLPKQLLAAIQYKFRSISKTKFKEKFYSFLEELDDTEKMVTDFWDKHEHKIKKWYLEIQNEDDIVISASPRFLLVEICKRTNINELIASEVDIKTGKYTGINCYGEEKVRRFHEKHNERIDSFYSDSRSDQPLADIAKDKYIVKGGTIVPW